MLSQISSNHFLVFIPKMTSHPVLLTLSVTFPFSLAICFSFHRPFPVFPFPFFFLRLRGGCGVEAEASGLTGCSMLPVFWLGSVLTEGFGGRERRPQDLWLKPRLTREPRHYLYHHTNEHRRCVHTQDLTHMHTWTCFLTLCTCMQRDTLLSRHTNAQSKRNIESYSSIPKLGELPLTACLFRTQSQPSKHQTCVQACELACAYMSMRACV